MKQKAESSPSPAETCEETDGLVRFGVSMPAPLVRDLDAWRKRQGYSNRSEAVRDLVRDALISAHRQEAPADAEMVGVVTLVYDHTMRQVGENLTQMQHHGHGTALAALHIHLSLEHCLEVIVLRGAKAEVESMADHLISARGVLHGKFVPTTTGKDLV